MTNGESLKTMQILTDSIVLKMPRLVISLLVLVANAYAGHEKYEGHHLFRISGSAEDIAFIEEELDLLSATPAARSPSSQLEALVRLSPEETERWLQYFDNRKVGYNKIAENLANILRDEETKMNAAKSTSKESNRSISWDTYYNYEEINDYLDEIGNQYPDLVTVVDAAQSFEGRQIKYLRISTTNFQDSHKPVIIVDAGMHAREWVTIPAALYTIHELVVEIADNILSNNVDWVIIPLLNPDGYEYSIKEDRMWRKTRSQSDVFGAICPGVDINRNFNHRWGTTTADSTPCSHAYRGPSVFSEPESNVVRNMMWPLINKERAALYISLQSFGNMILYPWASNATVPTNGASLHVVGVMMAEAMEQVALDTAIPYIVGNRANLLYSATGSSIDWARTAGVPLTFSLELPGYEYGFLVPHEYIEQIATEAWVGIATAAHYVLTMYNCPYLRNDQTFTNLMLKY